MYRRAMIFCIAAAAFATNAFAATGYSRWGVTAAVKAENDNTAIINPGTGYTQFTASSADYTVTAAPGYDIKTVILDGRGTSYRNPVNSYTKTFLNDRLMHTLVVITTPERYDVTTSKTGSGTFSPTRYLKVPFGTLKTPKVVKIVPHKGWRITSVTDNGGPAAITDLAGAAVTLPTTKTVKVTYAAMTGNHALAATFDLEREVVAKIEPATATELDVSTGPVAIRLDAFRSRSKVQPLAFTWALTANPADGATLTADPDYDASRPQAPVRLFRVTKPGTYTVRLTATDGVLSQTDSITYNVVNLKAGISKPCAHCHSDGSRKSTDQFFGGSIGDSYMASGHAKNPEGASCQDCHQDHSTMIAFPYDSCRNCHAPDKFEGRYAPAPNHFVGHSVSFAGKDTLSDCGICHNPHAATSGQGYTCLACHGGANFVKAPHFSNISASYMSARASCSNCHAAPGNITILKQWAESGHADPKGEAWVHYDFKTRAGCVQCHTTTGFVEFLASGSTSAWGTAEDRTKELLRCDGCHTSPTGTLRTAGAVAKTYNDMSGNPVTYANAGSSNLCISCHSGTQSGAAVAAATTLNQNFAAFNSHYMAAAGILYGKTGYEYQPTLFPGPHANVGIADLKGTGTNGPCVTCHMSGRDHKFTAPVTAVCASCHADMTEEKLDDDKASFAAAQKALQLMLEQQGIYYRQTAYPYFYQQNLTTQYTAWGSKEVLGAAFNFNLLNRETGAFAHNRQYALALVRDSIDWLDNSSLDGSGLTAIDALVTAGKLTSAERDSARAALAPLVGAGNVEKGDPVLAAAAGFTGSNTCQGCHVAQFAGWSNTLHNKPVKSLAVKGEEMFVNDGGPNATANGANDFIDGLNFNTATFSYTNPFAVEAVAGTAPILSSNGGRYYMQIGSTRYEVTRAQGGNGKWKQRYYTRIGNGYYVLPVQYNEETKQYAAYNKTNWYNGTVPIFSQGYGTQALVNAVADAMVSTAPEAGGMAGPAAASWENRCAGCHQTGVTAQYRIVGANTKPEVVTGYAELNVGCEACHGPGAVHASTLRKEDIRNPGRWITGNQTLLYRAQESCGRCHQRGEGKAQFSDPSFGTVKLHVEAPANLAAGLSTTAVFPLPGERLLDFMFADKTSTKIWDLTTTNTRPYDGTTTFFPSYLASSGHHQQWEDMEQGTKRTAGSTTGMTCFTCHDPHAATPGAIRATMSVLSDDGNTYTVVTSAEDNTLCFACHSEYNSFSNLSRQELAVGNTDEMALAVDNHVKSKYRANAFLGIPAKRITVGNYLSPLRKDGQEARYGRIVYKNGQCISCHMPATASSAVTFLDLQGRKQGDIRSHAFATIWAGQRSAADSGAPPNAPSSCSGCHPVP